MVEMDPLLMRANLEEQKESIRPGTHASPPKATAEKFKASAFRCRY